MAQPYRYDIPKKPPLRSLRTNALTSRQRRPIRARPIKQSLIPSLIPNQTLHLLPRRISRRRLPIRTLGPQIRPILQQHLDQRHIAPQGRKRQFRFAPGVERVSVDAMSHQQSYYLVVILPACDVQRGSAFCISFVGVGAVPQKEVGHGGVLVGYCCAEYWFAPYGLERFVLQEEFHKVQIAGGDSVPESSFGFTVTTNIAGYQAFLKM
ncbi:hypothetical protein FBULB1_9113 [Fusarium bulbicola]|nr:hypothetical protein FBULB1_9113 [Fusarium bulbicola]